MPKKRVLMPANSIGGRLDKIIDYFRMNAKQFAMELNISDGHLSDIRQGNRKLSRKIIQGIYIQFGINENWLLTGEGDMLSRQWPLRVAEDKSPYGLTARLLEYVEKIKTVYYEGSIDERAKVMGTLDAVFDDVSRRKEAEDKSHTRSDTTEHSPVQTKKEKIDKPA